MRKKKRYALFDHYPEELLDAEFLFQNHRGFVFKVSPKTAEAIRGRAILLSGAIWKLK
ncbi:MAG: hypothetical protein ACYCQJ_05520 [Nitrososphaerales archaeon]